MAASATDEAKAFNNRIIEEFRANDGRVSGFSSRTPIILIHHIGASRGSSASHHSAAWATIAS
jgi:hypothetical protein